MSQPGLERSHRGHRMGEFIVLAALVAIGCLGFVSLVGNDMRSVMSAPADSLADNSGAESSADEPRPADVKMPEQRSESHDPAETPR